MMKWTGLAALILGLLSQTAFAVNVNFKGILVIPDCTVNNNTPLEVDFGRVEIQTLTAANTAYH
ncbi:hypothetical protein DK749_24945, partial [Salmonella enterica subsp. salamae]|nr:hypothetical protein [Salmonella enterica subsp. salamae]